jgi:menaquinol-cytochrome c reductase iron-sulfur subunit
MNAQEEVAAGVTRRRVLVSVIAGAAGLIAAGLGIPALAYLALPPKTQRKQQWADAGDLSNLAPGTPREITFSRTRVDGWRTENEKAGAWVVQQADGKLTAFSPQCTHLGCAYHWEAGAHQFVCPCHGSRFAIDGRVLAGPAPRPLDRYEVRVVGARLWLAPSASRGAAQS